MRLFLFYVSYVICQTSDFVFCMKGTFMEKTFVNASVFPNEVVSSCDMTSNYCDTNCCSDKECSDTDKAAFLCDRRRDDVLFEYFNCDNEEFLRESFLGPALCLHRHNTPYIGEYFESDEDILNVEDVDNFLSSMPNVNLFNKKIVVIDGISSSGYKTGAPLAIIGLFDVRESFLIPSSVFIKERHGYCSRGLPIKFMIPLDSHCFQAINSESCMTNPLFKAENYIKRNNFPLIMDDGFGVGLRINVSTSCALNGSKYVFSNNFNDSQFAELKLLEKCDENMETRFSSENGGVCRNVIVGARYDIETDKTRLVNVHVRLTVTHVPLPSDAHALGEDEDLIYVLQHFEVFYKTFQKRKLGYRFGDILFQKK